MSAVTKTRDTIILFVLLLISFVRTSLGRNKPLPVSHADVPGVTQGLLFRHASCPAYLETANKFPFLRFVKDVAPGAVPGFEAPGQAVDNRSWARFLDPAGRILLFRGPGASLRRQYAIEFGGTFPYMRLSSAAIGRVGAALEFSPLRTSASADLRAYSLAIGPSSSIHQHGALLNFADIASSCTICCGGTSCAPSCSCTDCSCACACDCGCSNCDCCGPNCACCASCDCSNCGCG
jgi:hypothetical protein